MKKPAVDYRSFRPSRINEPEFSHLKLLLSWFVYLLIFLLTEKLIPIESCHVIHCPLDDMIPFCEVFLIPYVFWYILLIGSLLYFLLYDVDSFKKLQIFLIITWVAAMVVYIVYPNRQDLRPAEFPRDNIFTQGICFLYSIDTNTNVCPSMHVAFSVGIASAWLKKKNVSLWWKAFVLIAAFLICMSTVFIKQHSVVDTLTAIPICLLAEGIAYGKPHWIRKLSRKQHPAEI